MGFTGQMAKTTSSIIDKARAKGPRATSGDQVPAKARASSSNHSQSQRAIHQPDTS